MPSDDKDDASGSSKRGESSKRAKRSSCGFTFSDLKKFTNNAHDCRRALSIWQTRVQQHESIDKYQSSCGDDDLDVETSKSLAEGTVSMYTTTVKCGYPGETILFTSKFTTSKLKNSVELIEDGLDAVEEMLFNAIAFASSLEELLQAKAALRCVFTSNLRNWRPTMEQFLGILVTAFGADIKRLLPLDQWECLRGVASDYIQTHLLASTVDDGPMISTGDKSFHSLDNLEALVGVLSWINWKVSNLEDEDDADAFNWMRLLLALSLDVQCQTRFALQTSIQVTLRRMCHIWKAESRWSNFCDGVHQVITGLPQQRRHDQNMLHLCSLIPVYEVDDIELRSSSAVASIQTALGVQRDHEIAQTSDIVGVLTELLEEGKRAGADMFIQANSLNALLELIQLALIPSAISLACAKANDHFTTIVQSLISKRREGDGAKTIQMSFTDELYLRCNVNIIADKIKVYGSNTRSGLFTFSQNEGGGEINAEVIKTGDLEEDE